MSRKGKQIAAWVAIILLVLLYVVTLLVAIFDTSESGHWFMGCALATLIIPILTWMYIWMYGKLTGKETMADLHLLEDPKDKDVTADETKRKNVEKGEPMQETAATVKQKNSNKDTGKSEAAGKNGK